MRAGGGSRDSRSLGHGALLLPLLERSIVAEADEQGCDKHEEDNSEAHG